MATPVAPEARVVVSSRQASTRLAGEQVILGMDDGVYYGLDGVGARVWELLQSPRTVAEVADVVVTEYDVHAERALEDVLALVRDLVAHGLVDVVDSPAS
jgi:hypothetical protein